MNDVLLILDAIVVLTGALLFGFAFGASAVRPQWRLAIVALGVERIAWAFLLLASWAIGIEAGIRHVLVFLSGAAVTLAVAYALVRTKTPSPRTRRVA